MAIIERPVPAAIGAPAPAVVTPARAYGVFRRPVTSTGWKSWLFTVDHKKLGIMYGAAASGIANRNTIDVACIVNIWL